LIEAGGVVIGGMTQSIIHVHLPCRQTHGKDGIAVQRHTEISYLSPF
jgi:hypothetical protein